MSCWITIYKKFHISAPWPVHEPYRSVDSIATLLTLESVQLLHLLKSLFKMIIKNTTNFIESYTFISPKFIWELFFHLAANKDV